MKDKIAALLKKYAQPDDVLQKQLIEGGSDLTVDEVINRHAAGLAEKIAELKTRGDMTFKTLSKRICDENIKKADDALKNAESLLQSGLCDAVLQAKLNEFYREMTGLKAITQRNQPVASALPKASRSYLCAQIIIAWKFIRGDDKMPRRTIDWRGRYSCEPKGNFYNFLTGLLPDINQDELHRDILSVEEELDRLRAESDNPAPAVQVLD